MKKKQKKLIAGFSILSGLVALSIPLSFSPFAVSSTTLSNNQSNVLKSTRNTKEISQAAKEIWERNPNFENFKDVDLIVADEAKTENSKTDLEKEMNEKLNLNRGSSQKFVTVLRHEEKVYQGARKEGAASFVPEFSDSSKNWNDLFSETKFSGTNSSGLLFPSEWVVRSGNNMNSPLSFEKLLPLFYALKLKELNKVVSSEDWTNLNLINFGSSLNTGTYDKEKETWTNNKIANSSIYSKAQDRLSQYGYDLKKGIFRNTFPQEKNEDLSHLAPIETRPLYTSNYKFNSKDKAQLKQWVGQRRLINDIFNNPYYWTSGESGDGDFSKGVLMELKQFNGNFYGQNGNGSQILSNSKTPKSHIPGNDWWLTPKGGKYVKEYRNLEIPSASAFRYMDMPSNPYNLNFNFALTRNTDERAVGAYVDGGGLAFISGYNPGQTYKPYMVFEKLNLNLINNNNQSVQNKTNDFNMRHKKISFEGWGSWAENWSGFSWSDFLISGWTWHGDHGEHYTARNNNYIFPNAAIPDKTYNDRIFDWSYRSYGRVGDEDINFKYPMVSADSLDAYDLLASPEYFPNRAVNNSRLIDAILPFALAIKSFGYHYESTPIFVMPGWSQRSVIFNHSIPYPTIDLINQEYKANNIYGLDTLTFDFDGFVDNLNSRTVSKEASWLTEFNYFLPSILKDRSLDAFGGEGGLLIKYLEQKVPGVFNDSKSIFSIVQNGHFFHTNEKQLIDYEQTSTNLPDLYFQEKNTSKEKYYSFFETTPEKAIEKVANGAPMSLSFDLYSSTGTEADISPNMDVIGAIKIPGYEKILKFRLPKISLSPKVGPNLKAYDSYFLNTNQTTWSWLSSTFSSNNQIIFDPEDFKPDRNKRIVLEAGDELKARDILVKIIGGFILPLSEGDKILTTFKYVDSSKKDEDFPNKEFQLKVDEDTKRLCLSVKYGDSFKPILALPQKSIDRDYLFAWNKAPNANDWEIVDKNKNILFDTTNWIIDNIFWKDYSTIQFKIGDPGKTKNFVLDLPGASAGDAPNVLPDTGKKGYENFFQFINNKNFFNGKDLERNTVPADDVSPYSDITLNTMKTDLYESFYNYAFENSKIANSGVFEFGQKLKSGKIVPSFNQRSFNFVPDTFTDKAWNIDPNGLGVWNLNTSSNKINFNPDWLYFYINDYYNKDVFWKTQGRTANGDLGRTDVKILKPNGEEQPLYIAPSFSTEAFLSWANPNSIYELSILNKEDEYYKFFKANKFKTSDFDFSTNKNFKNITLLSLDNANPSESSFYHKKDKKWVKEVNLNTQTITYTDNPTEAYYYNPSASLSETTKKEINLIIHEANKDTHSNPEQESEPVLDITSHSYLKSNANFFNRYYRLSPDGQKYITDLIKKVYTDSNSKTSLLDYYSNPANQQTETWKQDFVIMFLLEKALLKISPYNFALESHKEKYEKLTEVEQQAFTKINNLIDVINSNGVNAAKQKIQEAVIFSINDASFSENTTSQINLNLFIDNGFLSRYESVKYFNPKNGYLKKLYNGYSALADEVKTTDQTQSSQQIWEPKDKIVNLSAANSQENYIIAPPEPNEQNKPYKLNEKFFLQETLSQQLSFRLSSVTQMRDTKFVPNWKNVKDAFDITKTRIDEETFLEELKRNPTTFFENKGNTNSIIKQVSRIELWTDPRTKYIYPKVYLSIQNFYQDASDPVDMKPLYEYMVDMTPSEIKNNEPITDDVWKGISYSASTSVDTKNIFNSKDKTLIERLMDQKPANSQSPFNYYRFELEDPKHPETSPIVYKKWTEADFTSQPQDSTKPKGEWAIANSVNKLMEKIQASKRLEDGSYTTVPIDGNIETNRQISLKELWNLPFPELNISLAINTWGDFITLLTDFGYTVNTSYDINSEATVEFVYNGFKILPSKPAAPVNPAPPATPAPDGQPTPQQPTSVSTPILFKDFVDDKGLIWASTPYKYNDPINFTGNIFKAFGFAKDEVTNFMLTSADIINDRNNWLNNRDLRTMTPQEWIKWAKSQLKPNTASRSQFLRSIIDTNSSQITDVIDELIATAHIKIYIDPIPATKPVKIELEFETPQKHYTGSLVLTNSESNPKQDYFYKFSSTTFSLLDAEVISRSATAGEVYDWNINLSTISTLSPFYNLIANCVEDPYNGLLQLQRVLQGDLKILDQKTQDLLSGYSISQIQFLFLQTIIGAKSSFINQFDVKQLENLNINLIIDHINQRIQLETFTFSIGVDSYSIEMDSLHSNYEADNSILTSTIAKLKFTNNAESTLLAAQPAKENNNGIIVLSIVGGITLLVVLLLAIAIIIKKRIWTERTKTLEHKSERKYTADF